LPRKKRIIPKKTQVPQTNPENCGKMYRSPGRPGERNRKRNAMLYIIANETAGSGNGAAVLKRVREMLEKKGIPFREDSTRAPGHAVQLADAAAAAGETEIVCLGGYGTLSEVLNGLAGRFVTMYFVPCGTGNDFVKVLDLPKDPVEALEKQLEGKPGRIDIGRLNDRYFINVSGSGFDVEVLRQAVRFKKLGRGILPYLLGILAALKNFRPLRTEIIRDGETTTEEVTSFSVGNGCYIGGGMKAVPHAKPDDGLFDVVIAKKFSRPAILRMLSRFIPGKHTDLPGVREFRCREITFRCPGMVLDVDGELIPADEAHYEILPAALGIRI
jgi:YegS/Rv2252/BmrU family lipid kinase